MFKLHQKSEMMMTAFTLLAQDFNDEQKLNWTWLELVPLDNIIYSQLCLFTFIISDIWKIS